MANSNKLKITKILLKIKHAYTVNTQHLIVYFDRLKIDNIRNREQTIVALFEGIGFDLLLEKTREIYPDDKNLQIILELAPLLGEVFKLAFLTLLKKGKLERNDLMMLVIAEM